MISLIKGYYKDPANGQVTEYQGYAIDVHDAVRRFPDQFSLKPWDDAKPAKQPETSIRKTV
jgi:hypothetical protein